MLDSVEDGTVTINTTGSITLSALAIPVEHTINNAGTTVSFSCKLRVGKKDAADEKNVKYFLSSPHGFIYDTETQVMFWEPMFKMDTMQAQVRIPSLHSLDDPNNSVNYALCVRDCDGNSNNKNLMYINPNLTAKTISNAPTIHIEVTIDGIRDFVYNNTAYTLDNLNDNGIDIAEKSLYIDSGVKDDTFYLEQFQTYSLASLSQYVADNSSFFSTWKRRTNCISSNCNENRYSIDDALKLVFQRTCRNVKVVIHGDTYLLNNLTIGIELRRHRNSKTSQEYVWWIRSDEAGTCVDPHTSGLDDLYVPATLTSTRSAENGYVKFTTASDSITTTYDDTRLTYQVNGFNTSFETDLPSASASARGGSSRRRTLTERLRSLC
jgi:hypothetical protein